MNHETKITRALLLRLKKLADGLPVSFSEMKAHADLLEQMRAEGVLTLTTHKSHKIFSVTQSLRFRDFLASELNIHNLEGTIASWDSSKRSEMVHSTGDSKYRKARSMFGFLVNSYEPIECMLQDRPLLLNPSEGSFVFISDYEHFLIPTDVLIIGIENSENFREIRHQRYLFDELYPNRKILFVSRYPQNGDLICWLKSVSNQYVHFGDLDMAGVNIYLTEFYVHLGERSSFLIPPDYDVRIAQGNRERFDTQYLRFRKMAISDLRVQPVIDSILHYHRGYDQEGYISTSQNPCGHSLCADT